MPKLKNASSCPKCGKVLDAFTGQEEGLIPSKGDITLCAYCGEILEFDENLNIHKLSNEKFNSFDEDFKKHLLNVQNYITIFNSEKN